MTGGEIAAALFGAGCVLFCFVAAVWADRRYSRFDRLPGLFGITGKVARLDPRDLVLYAYPVLAVTILVSAIVLAFLSGLPSQGSLTGASLGIGLAFVCSMAWHLWMIERWARAQG